MLPSNSFAWGIVSITNQHMRKISFIDGENRRVNLKAEITTRNGYPMFTVSGDRCGSSGQIQDHIVPATKAQKALLDLWEKFHLKDISKEKNFQSRFYEIATQLRHENRKTNTLELAIEEYGLEDYDEEAVLAYIKAFNIEDFNLSDFEDRYTGKYSDDAEFAKEQAESLGLIDREITWPNNNIDWEAAAIDLMQDYCEEDGYYFRTC